MMREIMCAVTRGSSCNKSHRILRDFSDCGPLEPVPEPRYKVRMTRLALAVAMLAIPHTASAGRTHFAWLYGTDIVPERGVELETWILEENQEGDTKKSETAFWWGPV